MIRYGNSSLPLRRKAALPLIGAGGLSHERRLSLKGSAIAPSQKALYGASSAPMGKKLPQGLTLSANAIVSALPSASLESMACNTGKSLQQPDHGAGARP